MKEINLQLTPKQTQAFNYLLDDVTIELVFGGGAGGGKTYLLCAWLIIQCGRYAGSRWLMGRSVLKRLKETTLATFFDIATDWGIKDQFSYDPSMGLIKWNNTSEMLLKDLAYMPSDPNFDNLGSLEITGAGVDEVSEVSFKAIQVLSSRIRYKLDHFGIKPKLFMSCNPSKNWLYSEYYKLAKEGTLPDHKKFVQSLVTDNPYISKQYIINLQRLKDKPTKERLLFGNWEYDDDPSALFTFEVINDLFTNKAKPSTDKYLTGDVARKGRDKMPIGYWEGLQLKKVYLIPEDIKADTTKSGQFILDLAETLQVRRSNIILDEDGVGGGVVDYVKCKGFINGSSAIQPQQAKFDPTKALNYANLKTQCYFKFAEKAEAGEVGIDELPPDQRAIIVEELEQIKQKNIDKDGKVAIVGKDEIKEHIGRSPDYADMIMMRFYYEVVNRQPRIMVI